MAVDVVDGDLLRVVVKDTGVGLDSGRLASVFRPFSSREDLTAAAPADALQPEPRRNGVGLSLSRDICHALGGDLVVSSDGPDRGCTAVATFKLEQPARGWWSAPALQQEDGSPRSALNDLLKRSSSVESLLVRLRWDSRGGNRRGGHALTYTGPGTARSSRSSIASAATTRASAPRSQRAGPHPGDGRASEPSIRGDAARIRVAALPSAPRRFSSVSDSGWGALGLGGGSSRSCSGLFDLEGLPGGLPRFPPRRWERSPGLGTVESINDDSNGAASGAGFALDSIALPISEPPATPAVSDGAGCAPASPAHQAQQASIALDTDHGALLDVRVSGCGGSDEAAQRPPPPPPARTRVVRCSSSPCPSRAAPAGPSSIYCQPADRRRVSAPEFRTAPCAPASSLHPADRCRRRPPLRQAARYASQAGRLRRLPGRRERHRSDGSHREGPGVSGAGAPRQQHGRRAARCARAAGESSFACHFCDHETQAAAELWHN